MPISAITLVLPRHVQHFGATTWFIPLCDQERALQSVPNTGAILTTEERCAHTVETAE